MDARIQRQLRFLADEFEIVVAAMGKPPDMFGGEFVQLASAQPAGLRRRAEAAARVGLRSIGFYASAYRADARVRLWRQALAGVRGVDAVIVNDLAGLPLAQAVEGSPPVIFDAHEHWTSESASWTRVQRASMRAATEWLVDSYVPRVAGMMTVSPGIAHDYENRTGVSPTLVTNAPFAQSLRPSEVVEPIRLVHIGLSDERRRLEDTIEAVRSLGGRFTLDLVLARHNEYRRRLERLVASDPNISVCPPVPTHDLLRLANEYDVGVFLLPANYPNQIHVLPNKLFDYIQARLAVAVGPSPEMAAIVREWDCGVVSQSFTAESFAAALDRLTVDEVFRMKQNADRAARVLTAEANRLRVLDLVRAAINGSEGHDVRTSTTSGQHGPGR